MGIISSDYYYSDILEKKYDYDVYTNFRNVDWLGEFSRNYLNNKTKKNLNAMRTIFSINEDAQNDILNVFNQTNDGKYNNIIEHDDIFDESGKIWLLPTGSSEIANDAWELFKKRLILELIIHLEIMKLITLLLKVFMILKSLWEIIFHQNHMLPLRYGNL